MSQDNNYDCLKLENQLCFPLYACAKEVVKRYKPFLDPLDLTYTQYITMMVLWEYKSMNVKELGSYLFLDSGTLTPVLKKLEAKKYLTRSRLASDERNVLIQITPLGEELKDKAVSIPQKMGGCFKMDREDATSLYNILHKMLDSLKETDEKLKEGE